MSRRRPSRGGHRPGPNFGGGERFVAVLLRGLKHHVGETISELTAVVTVSDDGGSSGRLRRDFGVPPLRGISATA